MTRASKSTHAPSKRPIGAAKPNPRYKSDVFEALHRSATALHGVGAIDAQTMRNFDISRIEPPAVWSKTKIRLLRQRYSMSQPILAAYLNSTPPAPSRSGKAAQNGPRILPRGSCRFLTNTDRRYCGSTSDLRSRSASHTRRSGKSPNELRSAAAACHRMRPASATSKAALRGAADSSNAGLESGGRLAPGAGAVAAVPRCGRGGAPTVPSRARRTHAGPAAPARPRQDGHADTRTRGHASVRPPRGRRNTHGARRVRRA